MVTKTYIKPTYLLTYVTVHPVYFQKTSAAPFGNSPQLRGAWSAHEQTCKISREKLPHHLKQGRDELRKRNFFVCVPLW